jgi:thiopeptide-type bacteriocin biosynthesis protein
VIDTYLPEIGRYGHGAALNAAEDVFAADSQVAATMLRNLPAGLHPCALVVANMVGIVSGMLGDLADAMAWLATRPVPATPAAERAVTRQAIRLAMDIGALPTIAEHAAPDWSAAVNHAWQVRADALAAYRKQLAPDANLDVVVESLLHMHHNRAIGIDRDSERTCRRLARQAALAWRTRRGSENQ